MGATHIINIREQDALEEIKTITNDRGVDVAWETAGNPAALQSALASVRRGGKLAIVGLPSQNEIPLNVPFIADNEIDIYGSSVMPIRIQRESNFLLQALWTRSIL